MRPVQGAQTPSSHWCVNCGIPLSGPVLVPRAWHWQCLTCHELVADQLELVEDMPGGAAIQLYRCRQCGTSRVCRIGWTTRCHICLDERSTGPDVTEAGRVHLALLDGNRHLAAQARQFLGLKTAEAMPLRSAIEAASYVTLAEQRSRRDRPGWVILATDVHGLPWFGTRSAGHSHGTWARHETCGRVAKLGACTVDCPACGAQPGSRTHQARRNDPYLLYLVRTRRWQKFGVGDERRVRTHMRGGAEVIQVLRGPFAQVTLAERVLKKRYSDTIPGRTRRGMVASFCQDTEVTRRKVGVDLTTALPGGEDVTSSFH